MSKLEQYIDFSQDISTLIEFLKEKDVSVPDWGKLKTDYDPKSHEILKDFTNLRDKPRSDGSIEKSCRLSLGMEKLLVKRMSEFMFAIPVKRIYHNTDNKRVRQEIAKAIESIFKHARINAHNIKRGIKFFASCEIFTLWYAVKSPNTLYGFNSDYKLKCRTFAPIDGCKLYPKFDDQEDMIAMSCEYTSCNSNGEEVTYFETYTEDSHYKWERTSSEWKESINPEEIIILKIPGVYLNKEESIYNDVSPIRKEIEYALSRDSNVIAYNSAPVLKVVGNVIGEEKKNDDYRMFRMAQGGDVSYVSWNQSIHAVVNFISQMKELFWSLSQLPDISFSNMQKLGNIGYDARETLLTDAHLKVGDESGDWLEFFDRETNVIKAFLKKMNTAWEKEIDNVEVEHVITPFIQKNEATEISKRMTANGGKPIESQRESIQRYGKSPDPDSTIKQIREEEAQDAQASIPDVFGSSN